jgi:hypothetical protein
MYIMVYYGIVYYFISMFRRLKDSHPRVFRIASTSTSQDSHEQARLLGEKTWAQENAYRMVLANKKGLSPDSPLPYAHWIASGG